MDLTISNSFALFLNDAASRTTLLTVAAAVIVLPLILNVLTGNGLAKSIPVIGMRRHAFTQIPAKFRYLTQILD
jgi:hypothetical protein